MVAKIVLEFRFEEWQTYYDRLHLMQKVQNYVLDHKDEPGMNIPVRGKCDGIIYAQIGCGLDWHPVVMSSTQTNFQFITDEVGFSSRTMAWLNPDIFMRGCPTFNEWVCPEGKVLFLKNIRNFVYGIMDMFPFVVKAHLKFSNICKGDRKSYTDEIERMK